jgi:hypothetical protein
MMAPPENARRFPNLPLTRLVPLAAIIEEVRPIYRRTVIRAVAGLGEPIELSGGVRSAVTHRPD